MSIMVSLRGEELWAAGCVQAVLPGVAVGQHDDNTTPSAHDLYLSVGGGRTFGAMEIAADPEIIESWKLLNGRDERWIVPKLIGGWWVHLRPAARVKRLLKELPALLHALEKDGITNLHRPPERHEPNATAHE
jgi:hypothetical protein